MIEVTVKFNWLLSFVVMCFDFCTAVMLTIFVFKIENYTWAVFQRAAIGVTCAGTWLQVIYFGARNFGFHLPFAISNAYSAQHFGLFLWVYWSLRTQIRAQQISVYNAPVASIGITDELPEPVKGER